VRGTFCYVTYLRHIFCIYDGSADVFYYEILKHDEVQALGGPIIEVFSRYTPNKKDLEDSEFVPKSL